MLIGNLTRDPEIKYTPKGTAIAGFSIAITRTYTPEGGQKQEEVTFVDCEAFARIAEVIGEYCKKGKPIYVEGRLKQDTWDDKATGQKRSKMKVVVETMQLLGSREGGEKAPERPATRPAAPKKPTDPELDPADPSEIPF